MIQIFLSENATEKSLNMLALSISLVTPVPPMVIRSGSGNMDLAFDLLFTYL